MSTKTDFLDPEWIENEPTEEVVVNDDEGATLAMRIVATREKEIQRIEKTAEKEIERIKAWADGEIERQQKAINYFLGPLEAFLRRVYEDTKGKTKTLKYPYGSIQLRKSPSKIEIDPEFTPEEHKDDPYVKAKITYSVDKTAIKTALRDSGEIPSYATFVEGVLNFICKPE